MLDLINGKDTLKVHEKIATGVVMSQPDYPYYHLPVEEVTGIPVYGVDDSTKPWLHPCEVMAGTAPCLEDGKIVNKKMWVTAGSYIIVCSGLGKTVEDARDAAYKIVDKISFPNSPMYRTDIGCRLEKQLPKLQAMGYCEGMVFCDKGDD
jgi:phosphoribosylamine--glycine ligase